MSNYIDIFYQESIGKLLFNYLGDHDIKINNKDCLYKLLYNFFIRKLEVLRQYLNKILEKRWIKSFTNLIGGPILFILKKVKIL